MIQNHLYHISILALAAAMLIAAGGCSAAPQNDVQPLTQPTTTAPVTEPVTKAPATTAAPDVNDELLILVNDRHPIPESYVPDLADTEFNQKIDKRAVKALEQMLKDCRAAGCNPLACSGYRSVKEQAQILQDKINEYQHLGYSEADARKEASKWILAPGTSEHHTGLAMDILDLDYEILDEKQVETDTSQWLMKHCWDYGFILRYPTEKKDITHVNFESWHYRYVGREHAKKMRESGQCLEEYVQNRNSSAF